MKIRLRRMSRLLSVATLSVALFSCADEEIVGGGPRVQEGLPAQIVLKVASGDNRIETRAAQDAANEKRVTNLYVFVFDENGDVCEGSREYHNVPANGVVLTARSKNNAQIAGIANFSETGVNSTYQLSLDALKEVKTKAELEALMAKLDQQTLERSSQFIMSGYAVDGSGNDVFNIPGSESGGIASFECTLQLERLDAKVEELRLVTLLNGEYDANNAILTFHAGAGGTEAQDWVEMLYRMYTRFAARHNWTVKVLDYLEGDEAGIKSASILVEGHNAYGFLRSENGVHRLVRVSPFDASGRRHTSFASLEVMPELDDAITVEIKPEDIKMEVFRSSGAGGQHINKTSSAVRLIHIPTGIVVSCQNERSQFQNRDMCMKMLAAKLYQIKEREHLDKISDIKGVQNAIAWGSQIRSYVFMPYTLVKDHRTGFENGNVNGVMDGDLDGFINAYLKMSSKGEL